MINKLVIIVPVLLLVFSWSWTAGKVMTLKGIDIPLPVVLLELLGNNTAPELLTQYIPHTSKEEMVHVINQSRLKTGEDKLIADDNICMNFSSWLNPSAEAVFSTCDNCQQVALIKLSNKVDPDKVQEYLSEDEAVGDILGNEKLTHMCIREKDDFHTVVVMEYKVETEIVANEVYEKKETPNKIIESNPVEIKDFSREELWNALMSYRKSHKKNDLRLDENICKYAEKRLQDHLINFETKSVDEYPNAEKYPLDSHAGFAADADSGYAFEVAEKNRLAENLAYWPSATNAIHVIEWGWDTSTEGHRETQLSEDYESACVVGRDGFYVAIFGS